MVASLTNEQDFIIHVALSIRDLFRVRYNIVVGFFFVLIVSISSICRHCILVNIPYKNAEKVREICQIKYQF